MEKTIKNFNSSHGRERKEVFAWDYVLSLRKRLSDSEAEEMKKSTAVFEKKYKFE